MNPLGVLGRAGGLRRPARPKNIFLPPPHGVSSTQLRISGRDEPRTRLTPPKESYLCNRATLLSNEEHAPDPIHQGVHQGGGRHLPRLQIGPPVEEPRYGGQDHV